MKDEVTSFHKRVDSNRDPCTTYFLENFHFVLIKLIDILVLVLLVPSNV